jgi:hypothetical protein
MGFDVKQDRDNKKVFLQIEGLKRRNEQALRLSFYRIGKQLTKESRRNIIDGPKTGKLVRIAGRSRRHRQSAPGEAPANLFGNLQKSVGFIVNGSDQMTFGAGGSDGITHGQAAMDVQYARRLELGDDTVAKRPYLIKAIDEKRKQTEIIFSEELKKELNRP